MCYRFCVRASQPLPKIFLGHAPPMLAYCHVRYVLIFLVYYFLGRIDPLAKYILSEARLLPFVPTFIEILPSAIFAHLGLPQKTEKIVR